MWRNIASNALTVLVVALFLLGGVIAWAVRDYAAPGPLAQAICLQVPQGATMRTVSGDLGAQGAVRSERMFRIGVAYAGLDQGLKAGSYLVPAGASMEAIADIITRGGASTCGSQIQFTVGVTRNLVQMRELDPATLQFRELARFNPATDPVPPEYATLRDGADTQYSLVVVPGVTSWQVVQGLAAFEILTGDVTAIPPEGMLAPDSYQVAPGDDRGALLARMQSAQDRILTEEWTNREDGLPIASMAEALTLASIIEKETGVADERPLVAGVLVNRIRQGWQLQFDPTIIYGITRGEGILDRPIRQSDIDGETERRLHGSVAYNTYVIRGLPPGPIALPARSAIHAALHPAQTDYMFFVATNDGTGGHAFAVTRAEHVANVTAARRAAEEAAAAAAAAAEDGQEN
ncbi:MAG: endolytic transglycosylase MltG [Rubellimicrobium sp.]|nr:endolytic transglycosylase MltG [Rubellimicrobium sp.]